MEWFLHSFQTVVSSAARPRSLSSSSTSRSESEYRRYQRTAQTISSGAVCRHLKIADRVAFLTLFSGYQPRSAIVATHPFQTLQVLRLHLGGPKQLAGLLPWIAPADLGWAPPLRLELRRQTQEFTTAPRQQIAGQVCLVEPLLDPPCARLPGHSNQWPCCRSTTRLRFFAQPPIAPSRRCADRPRPRSRLVPRYPPCQFQNCLRISAGRAEIAANRAALFANGCDDLPLGHLPCQKVTWRWTSKKSSSRHSRQNGQVWSHLKSMGARIEWR